MNNLINSIIGFSIWGVAKFLIILALIIYLIFAFVVVKQIKMMTKVVSGELDFPIKILGWLHFLFAICIIFLALSVL